MVEKPPITVSPRLARPGGVGLGEGSVVGTIPVSLRDLGLVRRTVTEERLSPRDAILLLVKDVENERMMVHLKQEIPKLNYKGGVWVHLGPLIQKNNAPGPEGASQRLTAIGDFSVLFQIIKYGGLNIGEIALLDVEEGRDLKQVADKFCQEKGFVKAGYTAGQRPWFDGLYVLPEEDTPDLRFPV